MPFVAVNEIDVYFELHGTVAPLLNISGRGRLDPDETFAIRCRLTDRRFDPDADEPIPGLGAYYDLMVEQSRLPPDPEQMTGLARQLRARAGHDVLESAGGAS